MTNEQNDQLFNSIFGETEPYKETMELNGKTYKIEGYRTPPRTKGYVSTSQADEQHLMISRLILTPTNIGR